jgi:hypothetical protein
MRKMHENMRTTMVMTRANSLRSFMMVLSAKTKVANLMFNTLIVPRTFSASREKSKERDGEILWLRRYVLAIVKVE